MAQEYVVKRPLKQRIANWVDEHSFAVGLGTITVFCAGVGAVCGYMIGDVNGYTKGLVEFRDWHTDISKTILDEAAHEGAFTALKYVRDDSKVYDQLLKDPDSVISKVGEKFYESDYAKSMLEVLAK